jgi:hypothetical protein
MREERITITGDNPYYPEEAAQRTVLQGSVGLRCQFATTSDLLPAYGFSLVYDAWLPLDDAAATDPVTGDVVHYQQGGGALGLRFNAMVAW